jgi:tetratricopeptide (TPR) repeat protein
MAAAALCATALLVSGCEKTAKETLTEGRSALAAKQYDRAEEALKLALQKDPSLVEAERLIIRVHIGRKEFDRAEAAALELGKKQGLEGDPKDLSTEQKSQRQFHDELLVELYKDWSESLDPVKNPQKLEEVAKKGIALKPSDPRLNTMLVELYLTSADALAKDGKKQEAAETYEKILSLRTMPDQRARAQQAARSLRAEAFKDAALARFEAEIKPGLVVSDLFDADKGLVMVRVQLTVDKALKPTKPEDVSKAREQAMPQIDAAFKALTLKLGALPEATDTSGTQLKAVQVVEEKLERGGVFTIKASAPLKEMIEYAHFLFQREQKDKKAAPDAPKDGGEQGANPVPTPSPQGSPDKATPAP